MKRIVASIACLLLLLSFAHASPVAESRSKDLWLKLRTHRRDAVDAGQPDELVKAKLDDPSKDDVKQLLDAFVAAALAEVADLADKGRVTLETVSERIRSMVDGESKPDVVAAPKTILNSSEMAEKANLGLASPVPLGDAPEATPASDEDDYSWASWFGFGDGDWWPSCAWDDEEGCLDPDTAYLFFVIAVLLFAPLIIAGIAAHVQRRRAVARGQYYVPMPTAEFPPSSPVWTEADRKPIPAAV
ncbi:hypothetical protein DFJ74DRAFT_697378 [Hyaloraphidium curvatum]|nr:hypothetical protein DFJ74DRAFT_697378 [Hyaloraphidium curvatum]